MVSASAALTGSYDYSEVARSVLIAIFASYAALDLSGRVNAARGRVRLAWLNGGAIAMGIGIWAMHFKGMLAFHLPVPVEYHWPTVLASLLVAVLASAVALYVSSRHKMSPVEAFTGSIFMGAGIAGMHYIGMAAMRLPAITRYSPLLVTCSILLAILFSLLALLMAFGLREETRWSVPRRLGSATVMGIAVSAMHYTGMAAASFFPASAPDLSHAISVSPIGNYGVVIATLIVLLAAVTTSSVDRQQARDQLRLVVDIIPQQIWSTPPDGLLDFCNAQFRGYVGLALEDLQGEGWQRIVHPDDLERALKVWRESVMNGTPLEQEVRHRRSDGQYRWFLVRGVPLRDPEGRIVRWYGTSTDIEDRKRAEDAVRRSEEHLRLVIDTIPQAVWSGPPDGSLDFFNAQWRSYTGLTQEEAQGKGWQRILHLDDRDRVLKAWRDSVMNGTPFEQEERRRAANGQYRWFLARGVPLKDSDGRIVRWYGTNTDIEDRKQAEDAVRRSEEHLRLVIDTAPAMLHSARPDGYVDFFNKRWLEYVGVSLEEISGWRWTNVIHPDDVEDILAKWRSSVATGRPLEAEARFRRADGEYRLMLLRKVPLRDEAGSIIKWYGSAIDIEDRKRAENSLRKTEAEAKAQAEELAAILYAVPGMTLISRDPACRLITGSRSAYQILRLPYGANLSMSAPVGERPSNVRRTMRDGREFSPEELPIQRAAATGQEVRDFEMTLIFDDGTSRTILGNASPLLDDKGAVRGAVGCFIDIEDRKRAEEELRVSEERHRVMVETASDAVISMDESGGILLANPATARIFGYDPAELIGKPLTVLMPEFMRKLHEAGFRRYLATGQRHLNWQGTEVTALRKNGQEFPVEVSFGEMTGNGHKVFTGFIRDISEKKRAEEHLRQAQEDLARVTRVVAMGELAATIAHEVNQPLTAIVTNANFCLRRLDGATSKPDELRAAITAIASDGTRASGVISRIRSLLKKGARDRAKLDINEIIQDVTTLLRHEFTRSRVSLRTELASDLPRVPGDPVQLQQVLINLIMNAIEATSSSTNGRRTILIRSAKNPDGVLVQVQDSGPGIAPELADRIFEPFFTTKAEGIGMGLSISHSIVESHGGQLGIVPSPTGALFEFTLPTD